jgi:two-component system chemotaxis response regulator CheB
MNLALPATISAGRRVRVMIVDDAVVVRGLVSRWVEAETDMEVVASLRTGREAVNQIERADPDVVVLDVDMPEMDGIAALPLLLAKKPSLIVIMASTLTRRNAEISLKALSLGATDYIPKPSSNREVTTSNIFHRELIEKIRQLGQRALRLRQGEGPGRAAPAPKPWAMPRIAAPPLVPLAGAKAPIALRAMPLTPPRVLLVGCSTGGPQALNALVAQIGGLIDRVPVLITQHMPPTFTAILAEHLTRVAQRPAHEARDGEAVKAGVIYLAPGGKHMKVTSRNGLPAIEIDDGSMVNFCKPAVDPLFSSAAAVWGGKALALVLTGMGADGLRGARDIVAAGGHIVAQDEASSVVWGMPGQVAQAGLCSAVLPLDEIATRLMQVFAGAHA